MNCLGREILSTKWDVFTFRNFAANLHIKEMFSFEKFANDFPCNFKYALVIAGFLNHQQYPTLRGDMLEGKYRIKPCFGWLYPWKIKDPTPTRMAVTVAYCQPDLQWFSNNRNLPTVQLVYQNYVKWTSHRIHEWYMYHKKIAIQLFM